MNCVHHLWPFSLTVELRVIFNWPLKPRGGRSEEKNFLYTAQPWSLRRCRDLMIHQGFLLACRRLEIILFINIPHVDCPPGSLPGVLDPIFLPVASERVLLHQTSPTQHPQNQFKWVFLFVLNYNFFFYKKKKKKALTLYVDPQFKFKKKRGEALILFTFLLFHWPWGAFCRSHTQGPH